MDVVCDTPCGGYRGARVVNVVSGVWLVGVAVLIGCLFERVTGWTQAINTLGMCTNPTEEQLEAEVPELQRPTRADRKRFAGVNKNQEVVQVVVFKGASGKSAVIRKVTHDLLYNNMKSIVVKTASM